MWCRTPLLPFFNRVCRSGAKFQISSKSDNKWLSYARFREIQDGGSGHLGYGAVPRFYHFSLVYVFLMLRFKFHPYSTINGRVIKVFVKFKMAAAAILDVAQNPAFTIFQ